MILAGIDIGTNTIRLLVADLNDRSFREIYSGRIITRLGEGLGSSGFLSDEAMDRSLSALAGFSAHARRLSASFLSAVGTSALRNAANAGDFIAKAEERLGTHVRVIAGEEEARLTLLGVRRAVEGEGKSGPLDSAVVIDIGGGSTEVIRLRPSANTVETSLPLGAVYLTERFIHHDPPTEDEFDGIRKEVQEELRHQSDRISQDASAVLVGTAGTITTLAAMDLEMETYDPGKINGHTLSRKILDGLLQKLARSSLAERRKMKGLEQGREDIILAGAIVAREIMEHLGSSEMVVSDWGLREGIVLDLYEKILKRDAARTPRC